MDRTLRTMVASAPRALPRATGKVAVRHIVFSAGVTKADEVEAIRAAKLLGVKIVDSAHGAIRVEASPARVRKLVETLGGSWQWTREARTTRIPERRTTRPQGRTKRLNRRTK